MRTALGWLGLILIALSVVSLLQSAFELHFVSPFVDVLRWYEATLNLAFGWAEPLLRQWLAMINGQSSVNVDLLPHWKHAAVVLILFFGADTIVKLNPLEIGRPFIDKVWSSGTGLLGLVLAALSGAAAGMLPGESGAQNHGLFPTVLTVVAFTLFWFICIAREITIYGWGQSFFDDYGRTVPAGVAVLIMGAVIVALGYFVVTDRNAIKRAMNLILISFFLGEVALYLLISFLREWIADGDGLHSLRQYPEDLFGFIGVNVLIACGLVAAFIMVNELFS